MKKTLILASAFLISSFAFAEKETVYISPNNDGVQDILEIPLQIKDRRYVSEWSLVIENEKGEIVRTIGNKDNRPEKVTFKTFWKSLVTPKSGVKVPAYVVWNGVTDSGEVAPDGNYFYYVTASDDNGNKSATQKLSVVVDNTAPEAEVRQPSSDEKIFGEGNKILFSVEQSGSPEDEWTGEVTDSDGKVVRTLKWTSGAPEKFDWAGTDDNGKPLPDGVYNYRISARDRAGNVSSPAGISNIIYSAEKPATNIAVLGNKYFSPNSDGVSDTVSFSVKIPRPDERSGNRLSSWSVKINGKNGETVRTFKNAGGGAENASNPPEILIWDGKNDSGAVVPEGGYTAVVSAKYLNGYETELVSSPEVLLDVTSPAAKVKSSSLTFSPDGDGNLDTLVISQEIAENFGSPIENWTGKIVDENGGTVRKYDFGSNPSSSVEWNGLKDDDTIASDGNYRYVLSASDLAGNSAEIWLENAVALDTSKTELMLASSPRAFNPASSSRFSASSVTISPVVKSGSAVSSFNLEIKDSDDKTVWSRTGASLPESFAWNGKDSDGNICADGNYSAELSTKSANGSEAFAKSQGFVIDTAAPSVKISPEYVLFSPDGDGRKDVLPAKVESSSEEKWVATITDRENKTVWAKVYSGKIPENFEWDGTDSSGNKVPDGNYTLAFSASDPAGNFGSAEVANIKVDNRETKAYVTADLNAFSPNGDGYLDSQKFNVRVSLADGIESWNFEILTPEGKSVRKWTDGENKESLPSEIIWDGFDSEKNVAEGVFAANLKISYEKGNYVDVKSPAFICSITPPAIHVKTSPQYFSPDNDGENDELYINLRGDDIVPLKNWSFVVKDPENGKPFWTISGKSSITEQVVWDGRGNNGELVQSAMDYPYTFTVTDTLGLTSEADGKISVDVLVIREGDVLKMAVPAIIFRADEADFGVQVVDGNGNVVKKGITEAQAKNNERVLKRIAKILNKFKNYTVTVEGHANSVTGLEDEETTNKYGKALVPLSQSRAEFVVERLKDYGVAGSRLTAVGRGGRQPVSKFGDKDNAWKNRRVEFILNK